MPQALQLGGLLGGVAQQDVDDGGAGLERAGPAQHDVAEVDPHPAHDLAPDHPEEVEPGEEVDADPVAPQHGGADAVLLALLAQDELLFDVLVFAAAFFAVLAAHPGVFRHGVGEREVKRKRKEREKENEINKRNEVNKRRIK